MLYDRFPTHRPGPANPPPPPIDPRPDSARIRFVLELRRGGVTDTRLLSVLETTPRNLFVAPQFMHQAWENAALPIGHHQTISQPLVVAQMTQALGLDDRMKVLEIGTGSGYQAAILAKLCRRLYTIERHAELLDRARSRFTELRLNNITAMAGDGTLGWPEQAPFDRIIITAAAADVPPVLACQLAIGGVMVVPVGDNEVEQTLIRVERTGDETFEILELAPVRFVPLMEGLGGGG